MNTTALRPDVDDRIAIGKDSAHRECIVVDRDSAQSGRPNGAYARVDAQRLRNADRKSTGGPVDGMGAHDGLFLVGIPTGETLRLEARCSQSLWPAHFRETHGTQDTGRSTNCKHATALARADLRDHLLDYRCNELGLFDLQRRNGVTGDVARDDGSNTNRTFAI